MRAKWRQKIQSWLVIGLCWWAALACVDAESKTRASVPFEDSPFGFHPAMVNMPGYPDNGFVDAKRIGVRWHRSNVYVFWFLVQPDLQSAAYDFSGIDRLFAGVPEDMRILANIAPEGSREEGYSLSDSYLPVDEDAYLRFVEASVERYDGDGLDDMPSLTSPIKYWQVGNEPLATKEGFARLQRMTYQAIKKACPDCQVLTGGVMQPAEPGVGFVVELEAYREWFARFYEPILTELDGQAIDIFDVHWYGDASGDYRKLGPVLDTLRTVLERHGFGEVPIWITEMGTYSYNPLQDPPPTAPSAQSEAEQAQDLVRRVVYSLSLGVDKIFFAFGLAEGFMHDDGYFDHTGLIYDGLQSGDLGQGVKKLAYYSHWLMTDKLEAADWNTLQDLQLPGPLMGFRFFMKESKRPVWVVWWDSWQEPEMQARIVDLPVGELDRVLITRAVPDAETGSELLPDDYPDFFSSQVTPVQAGRVQIELDQAPVFVEQLVD